MLIPTCLRSHALTLHQATKFIGAYTAALGGLDVLVFTGGIGEHAAIIRDRICAGLDCIGINLDRSANESHAPVISASTGAVLVRVMKTNEDLMIARHTKRVVANIQKVER